MTKEEFVSQLEQGASHLAGLPVSALVLRWTADALKRGEPPWWKAVAKAWEKRRFVAWSEAWSLYLTALHFSALSDAECPLVPFFPSCGGTAEAEPGPGLAKFFADAPGSFFENLSERHRRTYVAPRAAMWLSPALLFFQRRGLPYYVVEVNAGAGLNLAPDVVAKQKGFDSSLVAARIGLDPQPLDLSDIASRRWLTAGIWPDDLPAIAQLDAAIEAVQKRSQDEASFIQLAPCAPEQAPAFVTQNIPSDDADVGLLLFNMGTTVRMTDAEYAAYGTAVAAMLKPWGDRGLWVEMENVRGETYSATYQLRVHRLAEGAMRGMVMASADLGSSKHSYAEAAAAFLK
ncbi:MAG: hypothetical protein A2V88_04585 [Elusimicrobia bacterium RBG_16_66_12]|nr:MAG: hypothetical protein A2V88_04585 [Elusimicrobia bacterium RBG_16_66_12]